VRIPKVLSICESDAVIGSPFYLMDWIEGEVMGSSVPVALDDVEQRRLISVQLIDALAEIHSVDARAAALQAFGKPHGYLQRQLRRFSGLWELNRTRELQPIITVRDWLQDHLPRQEEATIVHGDFRLGNTIFAAESPPRLLAVLDWEMATIGDPLADIGYLCMMWSERDDPHLGLREQVAKVTRAEGFLSRAQLVARYEQVTGRSIADLRWYETLALWKMAIFMEGNYRRAVAGSTDDPYLRSFDQGVVELAQAAERTAFRRC
jgi:aminoglycoside phosphotransferase (APT) family kinase protein